jgi:hypothetical protein
MDHWSVTVERSGEKVITIERASLSGRDLTEGDAEAIRTAAHHLLAFIGDPMPLDAYPKLSCDVMVAPHTVIRRGCDTSTLLLAISKREGLPDDERVRINFGK